MAANTARIVHLEGGRLKGTSAVDINALFRALPLDANTLVIHFHGGLVSAAAGREIAARLQPEYTSAGGLPVFVVWESGWYETITNNLDAILSEAFFKSLLTLVVKAALGKLGGDSPGERGLGTSPTQVEMELELTHRGIEPFAGVNPDILPRGETLTQREEEDFEQELTQDAQFADAVSAIVNDVDAAPIGTAARSLASGKTQMSPEVLAEIREEKPPTATRALIVPLRVIKGAIVVLVKVIARFASKRHHGVHATVIEEIVREFYAGGVMARIWGLMKKDTADAFEEDAGRFGGTAMLASIKALWESGRRPRLLLIGHSTGAVYICNWLRAADTMLPSDVKFEVVFLAPACTLQLFERTLKAHRARIGNFRMFSMKDEFEKKDAMVRGLRLLYPRSLLYFISGVLEERADIPIAGMQRFYAGSPFDTAAFPEIRNVLEYLAATPNSQVWSTQVETPGLSSESLAHGDFDNDRRTVDSLKRIIGEGF